MQINPFDLLPGKVVQNENGTFYFKEAGNNMVSNMKAVEKRLHREDGPAIVLNFGTSMWYRHGELHRIDGPAIEDASGTHAWCINGKTYNKEDFIVEATRHNTTNRIKTDKGFYYYKDATKVCINDGELVGGELHRLYDLPAFVNYYGTIKEWWHDGKRHRLNGPAVEHMKETAYSDTGGLVYMVGISPGHTE